MRSINITVGQCISTSPVKFKLNSSICQVDECVYLMQRYDTMNDYVHEHDRDMMSDSLFMYCYTNS